MSVTADAVSRTTAPVHRAAGTETSLWLDCRRAVLPPPAELARLLAGHRVQGVLVARPEGGAWNTVPRAVHDILAASPPPAGAGSLGVCVDAHPREIPADGPGRPRWPVGRATPVLRMAPTRAGLAAASAAVSRGTAVVLGPVRSTAGYRRAARALVTGLESATQARDPARAPLTAVEYSPAAVDTAVDSRLDRAGSWEAKAMRGRAGVAGAHLVYQALLEDLRSPRWARLAGLGAAVPHVLWDAAPHPAMDRRPHYAERIALPGTSLALTPGLLRELGDLWPPPVPRLPDLDAARHIAGCLRWFGVRLDDLGDLDNHGEHGAPAG